MAKPCARCRSLRIQFSLIFMGLIGLNLMLRLFLHLEITTIKDALLLPSLGVILAAMFSFFFKNKRPR